MASIQTVDARPLFTKMLIDVFTDRLRPTEFLRSFFPADESGTKELSIEVQRMTERIAVDVFRGTEGNRNNMSRSTEKIFVPPYYREYFDATQLDFYDQLFGRGGMVDEVTFADWIDKVAEKLSVLQDKIERSYEVQCSEVLQTGIVQLNAATNISFRRKATSIVDVSGSNPWSTGTVDPIASLLTGCNFLRQVGKAGGGTFNCIFGSSAYEALVNNDIYKERADVRNFKLDDVRAPQRNAVGASLHGMISVGSYMLMLWTYPQFYDNAAGTSTPYIDPKNVILIPEAPRFKLGFAAVPFIFRDERNAEFPEFVMNQRGQFMIGNYVDPRNDNHIFDIKSAGVAIPTAVDQIYTLKVLV